jgi:hypothetical protein
MIIQSGISEVVYCSDKHHHTMSMTASRRLLDMARVSTPAAMAALTSLRLHCMVVILSCACVVIPLIANADPLSPVRPNPNGREHRFFNSDLKL